MQSSYWGYFLVTLGVAIVGLSIAVNGLTTTSTENNRDFNELKIDKEKYEEVVIRSIADNEAISGNENYTINIYGLYEAPPKASIEIITKIGGQEVTVRSDAIIQILAEEMKFGDN